MLKRIYRIVIILVFLSANLVFAQAESGKRYISLAPSTTEILFALGLDEEVVGVSSFCNYPQAALTREKIGNFSQPNIEKILSLKPDYVFCTGLEQAPAIHKLKTLGLKVYIADPKNIDELLISIKEIGEITGTPSEAEDLIREIEIKIGEIQEKVAQIPAQKRLKIFVEIWDDPLMTVGEGSFVDELFTTAGGINIAKDASRAYSIFSPEAVIKRNPDCIFLTYMDKGKSIESVIRRLGWNEISAVKNNRIYNNINPDTLLRPGPRIAEGLAEIYKRLYNQ